jgi:hypothetical protein
MTTTKNIVKNHTAKLTHKSDKSPVKVPVDDTARLREITALVKANNQSALGTELIVCQIYFESRFDKTAHAGGSSAKGLMQMTTGAVKQVYKYRVQKSLGHMPNDKQKDIAFTEGAKMHSSDLMLDEATNIHLGTEYLQYFLDNYPTIDDAYIAYRGSGPGITPGVYYKKINACAAKLKTTPDSMQPLIDMVQ